MKRIVSVSLGSSKRNSAASVEVLGEEVIVERIGTDGDIDKAIALIRDLDGKVDAFGMGGIDLYIWAAGRRYAFRTAKKIAAAAVKTPIVDGSGLKNTLERRVVEHVNKNLFPLKNKKVLLTVAVDRFGMAEAVAATGADVIYGDIMFALGLNIPLRSIGALHTVARVLLPVVTQLPFEWLYPTGKKQDERKAKYPDRFQWADLICGDAHYILRHMPDRMEGKIILTNTVTKENVEELRARGVGMLITTTPNLAGRSFGTNVMEGLIVAAAGKRPEEMTPADYEVWLEKIGFTPRIERLNDTSFVAD